ncbi:hypothetical protein BJ912DRAFT_1143343 [Pholiota molesta]|nr:hypothetical protein BJ912DRAFT_1143343 [Pholiota molesta]
MASATPPARVRTLYDETLRSVHYTEPCIMSMATRPNLVGRLAHHAPTTDGSFSICIASGEGVFISKALLESIPRAHRPALDRRTAGQAVATLTAGDMRSIGTTLFPLLLTDYTTGEKFRIVLHAIVLPNLFMGMFISGGGVVRTTQWRDGVPVHGFGSGDGDEVTLVKGI